MGVVKDLSGERFGKLTVVKYAGSQKHRAMFECVCDCGEKCIKAGQLLSAGKTRSCGCLASKNTDQTTHGQSKTHLYGVWCTMKSRCHNPNSSQYKNYGARGIKVCEEWMHDFSAFQAWAMSNGYAEGLTIDRIDVNGDYSPDNCRWTSMKAQNNNRGNNRLFTYKGQIKTLHELADEYGVKYTTLWMRINRYNWTLEKALETP